MVASQFVPSGESWTWMVAGATLEKTSPLSLDCPSLLKTGFAENPIAVAAFVAPVKAVVSSSEVALVMDEIT